MKHKSLNTDEPIFDIDALEEKRNLFSPSLCLPTDMPPKVKIPHFERRPVSQDEITAVFIDGLARQSAQHLDIAGRMFDTKRAIDDFSKFADFNNDTLRVLHDKALAFVKQCGGKYLLDKDALKESDLEYTPDHKDKDMLAMIRSFLAIYPMAQFGPAHAVLADGNWHLIDWCIGLIDGCLRGEKASSDGFDLSIYDDCDTSELTITRVFLVALASIVKDRRL